MGCAVAHVGFHVIVKILNDHIAAIFSGRNLSPMPSGYNLYKRGNHHLAWGDKSFLCENEIHVSHIKGWDMFL